MTTWRQQRQLAKGLLIAFAVSLVVIWALSPGRALITEKLLGNIALSRESGFDASFGALSELVKDQGGSQPVPPQPTAPLRTPEYRGLAWLNSQDAQAYTLQVAVFSDERSVGNFLSARNDRSSFVYFTVPELPDPALPEAVVTMRYAVGYGSFATRAEAVEVGATLADLPGSPLPRTWGSYQALHAALPPPVPVPVLPPAAEEGAAPAETVPPPEQDAQPLPALPMPGAHETAVAPSDAGATITL